MPNDTQTPQAEALGTENLNAQATFRVTEGDAADARLIAALERANLSDVWRRFVRLDDLRAEAARVRAAHTEAGAA